MVRDIRLRNTALGGKPMVKGNDVYLSKRTEITIASPKGGREAWEELAPENYANIMSHESLHRAIDTTYGSKFRGSTNVSQEEKQAQMGIHQKEGFELGANDLKVMKEIGPEGLHSDIMKRVECANCGDSPDHMHGQHGCCGRQGCHMKLFLAHTTYGEGGVNRLMQKDWPSLRGLL